MVLTGPLFLTFNFIQSVLSPLQQADHRLYSIKEQILYKLWLRSCGETDLHNLGR